MEADYSLNFVTLLAIRDIKTAFVVLFILFLGVISHVF